MAPSVKQIMVATGSVLTKKYVPAAKISDRGPFEPCRQTREWQTRYAKPVAVVSVLTLNRICTSFSGLPPLGRLCTRVEANATKAASIKLN